MLCFHVLPVVTASHSSSAEILPSLIAAQELLFQEWCLGFTKGKAGPQALISFAALKFLVGCNPAWERHITSVRRTHEILFCLQETFLPCFDHFVTVSQPMTHFHETPRHYAYKIKCGSDGKNMTPTASRLKRDRVPTGGEQRKVLFPWKLLVALFTIPHKEYSGNPCCNNLILIIK